MRFLHSLFSRPSSEDCSAMVHALLADAEALGLGPVDVDNAREMLRYDEKELCFDIIANQFHSYDLEITPAFYELLARTGRCLQADPASYEFNQELIRSDVHVPKPVRESLARVIGALLGPFS